MPAVPTRPPTLRAHRPPPPGNGDPDHEDRSHDWPDREPHRPDEVREPPQPRRRPIEEPRTPAAAAA